MSFFPRDLAAPGSPAGPVVEWEESACPLCSARNWSALVEAPDARAGGSGLWFAVVQCQDCGLCFTNPRPSCSSIGQFYAPVHPKHKTRTPWRTRLHGLTLRMRAAATREMIPWHGQGRLLDFGCGCGSFLERMRRQGWHVTGVDISPQAIHMVRRELGLPALLGSLPHEDLEPGSFDVITMWQSLEHVHEPLPVLRAARRLLVPGGRLLVAVPNIDSLPFRWFGASWIGLDLPRHLTHFTPWTLHAMLERAGFRVHPVRQVRHTDWLRASARLAQVAQRGPHWFRWLTKKPAAGLATWYSYFTQQADCLLVAATPDPGILDEE